MSIGVNNSSLNDCLSYNSETDYFGFYHNGAWIDVLKAGLNSIEIINAQKTSGTDSSHNQLITYTYDGDYSTNYLFSSASGTIVYELQKEYVIKQINIIPVNGGNSQNAVSVTISGSADNSNWDSLYSGTLSAPPYSGAIDSSHLHKLTTGNTKAYKYIKVTTNYSSWSGIAEISFE